MILSEIAVEQVYIACGYTDMRKSIDGLAATAQQTFRLDPLGRSLFLFCGRRSDRLKALYWEGDGFILLYKRLEQGRYQWPRHESEARQITPQQLRWLLEGLRIEQPKALKPLDNLCVI
jgi:transposase